MSSGGSLVGLPADLARASARCVGPIQHHADPDAKRRYLWIVLLKLIPH